MKKMMLLILPITVVTLCAGCGNKKSDKGEVIYDTISKTEITVAAEYYFSGDFTYLADAAVLKDGATGTNIPIAMKGVFPEMIKQYTSLNASNGIPVFGEFKGYLANKGADEEGPEQQLVVTYVIGFDQTIRMNPKSVLVGTYQGTEQALTLNSNFTYSITSKSGESEDGKWYMTSENTLICSSEGGTTLMNIDYKKKELSTQDDSSMTYKKEQ